VLFVLLIVLFVLLIVLFVLLIVLFHVLFVCKYVLYNCHQVLNPLQLTDISYHIKFSLPNTFHSTYCISRQIK